MAETEKPAEQVTSGTPVGATHASPLPGMGGDLRGLLGDFRLLLILFVSLRLALLLVYQPLLTQGVERGVSAGGDLQYYFQLASLTDRGLWPFRDWWAEFPPVWPVMITAIYRLLGANANYPAFAMASGVLMAAFDVGNLVLLRKIGARLHGASTGMALAWVYAVSAVPLVFIWWTFEPMVAFCFLLGIWSLLRGQEMRSAAAIAVGALTKFTPILILGAVWRFRDRRRALGYSAIAVGLFALVYALLFVQNAAMTLPSLTAQFSKASYESVWALVDGNFRTGNFGSLESHFDPAQARVLQSNTAKIPGWLRLGVAGVIGVWVFLRTRRFDDKGLVAFASITLLIFFLQAQGWSPQWLAQIVPLVLLCFPTRDGVMTTVLLTLLTFAEYPFLFIRTGDSGGVISGALVAPFAALVLARTAILIGVCVALYKKLRQQPIPEMAAGGG